MEVYTRALASLPFPVVAVIEGWAVGGGLNLAAACDIRISTPDARFGVPIAKTVGNCLSIYNYARLVAEFGPGRAKRMLILGQFLSASEALTCGFLTEVVEREAIEEKVSSLRERILGNAPITMRVSKQAISRVLDVESMAEAEDLIREAYGSKDFKTGVAAFREKRPPQWEGH
jgi:enoyl-CoA hydratase/carnithine racemase